MYNLSDQLLFWGGNYMRALKWENLQWFLKDE